MGHGVTDNGLNLDFIEINGKSPIHFSEAGIALSKWNFKQEIRLIHTFQTQTKTFLKFVCVAPGF